jgi:oligosaccharyltransferase complex subunit delta (ribophorin II)
LQGSANCRQTHNIIPSVLLKTSNPLKASIVIGSFGSSTPFKGIPFDLSIALDANAPQPSAEPQVRYGKQPEIHHIFRADPKSPPKIITLVFAAALIACIPALFIGWGLLGANLNHLSKALGAAPISHTLFFGSIIAMEGVFFLYYTSWTLFQTLPVAGVVSLVAFLSGSRALSEVQQRRLSGQR